MLADESMPLAPVQGPTHALDLRHRLSTDWRHWLSFPSHVTFVSCIAVLWAIFYNDAFWQKTSAALWHPTLASGVFLLALLALTLTLHTTLLLMIPSRLLRPVAGALFIVASLSSYFCNTYGAVLDKDMLRNAVQTDAAEIGGLLNGGLVIHLLLSGVLPALLVQYVSLPAATWRVQLRQRAVFLAVAWAVSIAGMFAAPASYAVFLREHKPLRFMLIPEAPLSSFFGLLSYGGTAGHAGPLLDPAGKAQRVDAQSSRPRVIFMVVGETARAADFSLGGYQRSTNPALEPVAGLAYFDRASSCGTATAVSVPCMFSSFDRGHFEVSEAGHYVNLLDTLFAAGVDVEWRDNNAGCKGVCARVVSIEYHGHSDPALCPQSYCYDEIMLQDLGQRLHAINRDTVIVFHQIGSHGPAYSERYPPRFEIFKPACHSHELHLCTAEELRNAYDNTIAYTDQVLARQIELLRAAENVDGMLIYASDHGESLGERGIYLHGMPYRFAPKEQTSVPLMIWTSPSMRTRLTLDSSCLQLHTHDPVSHDNLYHTLMGALGLRNDAYSEQLDLLASCRGKPGPQLPDRV